jgi:eukaryotic-like serine/threonine-protein kinase
MAISSDGRFIIYNAIEGNPSPHAIPRLYLRRTDQMEAKPIAGTEGGISPFLSPGDRWVGFWADGKLMKIPVEGGVPAILCDVRGLFGASWGPDNNIVFSPGGEVGLFSVSADGGKPEALTTPDRTKEEESHRLPHCLPGGKGVLFTIMREYYDARPSVAVLDLKTRIWRVLMEDAADACYVPTGHLVFLRRGILMAAPFDLNRPDVTGQPVPVVANVMQAISSTSDPYNTCAGQFSISASGWLIYVAGGVVPDMEDSLVWVDQGGTSQPIASFKAPFVFPRLSPDGQRIAYATMGSEWRLNVFDLTRGTVSQLPSDGKSSFLAAWTTDSKRLVFSWWKSGQPNLHWQPADGSSPMERLAASEYDQYPGSLTPDGATLAFAEWHPDTGLDILLLDLRSRRVTPFLNSRFFEAYPAFSPDGRWLAYYSTESGQGEVYVRSFPNPGGKWKLSLEGGKDPLWARNGKQLFYRWQDQVWAVDVRTDTGFTPGKPRLLFDKPGYGTSGELRNWDISPDGQRFLMVKLDDRKPEPVTEMILVQNWFEELKRLVPTGK